jgi:hypothetical protein
MSARIIILTLVACLAASLRVGPALACGDADASGTVTVSDGVQTLRAAAGLSNRTVAECDVDASGGVTITDGVNVLRAAAGLAVTLHCGGGGVELAQFVASVTSAADSATIHTGPPPATESPLPNVFDVLGSRKAVLGEPTATITYATDIELPSR